MRVLRILAAFTAFAVTAPAPLAADSSWTIRFHGAFVDSSASHSADLGSGFSSRVDGGGGIGIGAEYRLSERFGLELSTLLAGLEIETKSTALASTAQSLEMSMVPLTLGLPIHLGAGDRVDFFVAPTLSFVQYTDIETTVGGGTGVSSSMDVGSDVGLGAALGLDVPFGKGKWAISTGLRYMQTAAESTDIDPLIVTIGFAYRF